MCVVLRCDGNGVRGNTEMRQRGTVAGGVHMRTAASYSSVCSSSKSSSSERRSWSRWLDGQQPAGLAQPQPIRPRVAARPSSSGPCRAHHQHWWQERRSDLVGAIEVRGRKTRAAGAAEQIPDATEGKHSLSAQAAGAAGLAPLLLLAARPVAAAGPLGQRVRRAPSAWPHSQRRQPQVGAGGRASDQPSRRGIA